MCLKSRSGAWEIKMEVCKMMQEEKAASCEYVF